MWGQIIADISYSTNYWFGFPESNSDIILNLTHWQYWWWFWFTYFLCLYYLFFLKLIRSRTLKFNPKIVTSYRAHGKWGDFIICVLPISWCVNILSNSNFILRMVEWQTESNLFTVRIRGKQWYWIYKLEIKTLLNIPQVPKNIGHNHWILFNKTNFNVLENCINFLQLKFNNTVLVNALQNVFNQSISGKNNFFFANGFYTSLQNEFTNNNQFSTNTNNDLVNMKFNVLNFDSEGTEFVEANMESDFALNILNTNYFNKFFILPENIETINEMSQNIETFFNNFNNTDIINFSNYIDDTNRYWRTNWFNNRYFLKLNYINNEIDLNFNFNNNQTTDKSAPDNIYLVIKQKRYTPIQKLKMFSKNNVNSSFVFNNSEILKLINNKTLYKDLELNKLTTRKIEYLNENGEKINNKVEFSKQQEKLIFRTRRKKTNMFFNLNNRRLLRTRRILVLPANINITLITNSFDVVHSWYIPGLGIKMDCIPGRSTHHTINIDHTGFYYGQCAEICGRHHHHMPIRVCALPFEHFLIWWFQYGLPYFNAIGGNRKLHISRGIKYSNW